MRLERWWPALAAVCALALVRGIFLAGLVPPMNGPDEPAHFDYVQRMGEDLRLPLPKTVCNGYSAENRELTNSLNEPIKFRPQRPMPPLWAFHAPDPDDRASRATTGCGPGATYPPLYYATAALAYRLELRAPYLQRLFAARLASVAWAVVNAALAFMMGLLWSGRARDGALLGIVIPAQPMIGHLSAVVNNDAMVLACATAAFAGLVMLAQRGPGRGAWAMLVVSTVAGVMAKPLLVFELPVIGIGIVLALGPARIGSWLRAVASMAPAALATLLWSLHTRVRENLPVIPHPRSLRSIAEDMVRWDRMYVIWHKTYWSCWGWLDTWINDDYYLAIALAIALAAAGFALAWRRMEALDRRVGALALGGTVFVVAVLHVLELFIVRSTGTALIQGRYLLPIFPLQALALVAGLRALSRRLDSFLDGGWTFAAVLLVVDAAGAARALIRYYA